MRQSEDMTVRGGISRKGARVPWRGRIFQREAGAVARLLPGVRGCHRAGFLQRYLLTDGPLPGGSEKRRD